MLDLSTPTVPMLRAVSGRRLRVVHLTTVDMSLALLLETELRLDVAAGLDTFGVSAPGPYVPRVERTGATHRPIAELTRRWDPRGDAAAMRALLGVIRELRPDILHTHNPKTGVMGRVAGRLARVPVVVNTCHGLWATPEDPPVRRSVVYALESGSAALSDAELYQNAQDRTTLSRWVRQHKTEVVGNGTDLQRFRPDRSLRAASRDALGVSPHELLVGGVGRLVAEKGISEFCEMARRLAGLARFVWAGPADPDKKDRLTAEGVGVQFLGEVEDMPAFYNALDVFVLPSYREGFSRSAIEASACAVPSVLSDIRGCREVGARDREVLLVPPRDPVGLTAAVERLLRDGELRTAVGEAARARAESAFDQRAVALASLQTYRRVAERKRLGWTEVPA